MLGLDRRLRRIEDKIDLLIKKEKHMSATLDQILQDVKDESTITDSIIALLNGVEQQLKDALAGQTIPPANQAKIDAIFDGIEANKAKVSAAITANTPAAR